ncbi:MAG: hypothetical protein JRI38_07470 [Deltaproteobacteria bacterium]|nr:hypothetical protein [Deltaproteobacteria bacterium]
MNKKQDIRDRPFLSGSEVAGLNFIKDSDRYQFRKHYREGLRSHIFEVLSVADVLKETKGERINGIRWYPRARPGRMLRILRTKFDSLNAVIEEIDKYNLLLKFLGPGLIARSDEFIVDYREAGTSNIVLCGFQEYVEGEIIDPWNLCGKDPLSGLFRQMPSRTPLGQNLIERAKKHIRLFVKLTRQMITDTGYIPDLAGFGNLIMTPEGDVKLVDINNIIAIRFDATIRIDDKGYPACDKSVEVLSILEQKILHRDITGDDPIYGFFLSQERKKKVKTFEKAFYLSLR